MKVIEKFVEKYFKGYISLMEDEYFIIKSETKCEGKFYKSFSYPSNLYKDIELKEEIKEELYIQVGNSAQSCNNHLEIFQKLKPYKNRKIKIFCILSYGDEGDKKNIILKGNEIFGEKFIPIVNFMNLEDYIEFLSKIDIAIFAHNMQKGFGNITSLIGMKKTVYLKQEVPTYKELSNLGIKVKSFNKFENLEKLDNDILEKNQQIMKERFSKKKLKEEWKVIFDD